MSSSARPRHLWPDYASQFSDQAVADAYEHRPPYPKESVRLVAGLIEGSSRCVLELGAGSGDFTQLLAEYCEHITAVEPAAAMRVIGEQRTLPFQSVVEWARCSAEAFEPTRVYDAAVAAESLHWMDWNSVLPKVGKGLSRNGFLVIVERDLAQPPAWEPELVRLISEFSTNQHYRPLNLVNELEDRGLFELVERRQTTATRFRQSVTSYVESIHSRNGFSRERMSTVNAAKFDRTVTQIVAPYSRSDAITLETMATISWGNVT